MSDDFDAEKLIAEFMRELQLADEDTDRDLAMLERELDAISASALVLALAGSGSHEVCVQVVPAPTDVHWSPTRHWRDFDPDQAESCQDWTCPHRRGGCDIWRYGVIRELPERRPDGEWSVYIEDMSPGDDGNPTRYLSARHVKVLRSEEER